MRHRDALAALLVLALANSGPAQAQEERPLYGEPEAFGPENVAFPWFAAFSPDGRWVGFSDGETPYVEVWDAAKNKRAWPTDGKARRGTHRVSFSADSKQLAFVDGEHLVVLGLADGAWKEANKVTLLAKPPTSARVSPLRLDFLPSGQGVVLATGDGAVSIDLTCGCIEDVGDWKDVLAAFTFPDGSGAVSREGPFSTHVVPLKGEPSDVAGLLLESDAKGATWLVASDKRRFDLDPLDEKRESHLALEIREARSATARAAFELVGKRDPSKSSAHRLLVQAQFSPDGKLLATVEGTGSIVLRDATTGAAVQTIREYAPAAYATGVAFSPDCERLLTAGRRSEGAKCLLWKRRGR